MNYNPTCCWKEKRGNAREEWRNETPENMPTFGDSIELT